MKANGTKFLIYCGSAILGALAIAALSYFMVQAGVFPLLQKNLPEYHGRATFALWSLFCGITLTGYCLFGLPVTRILQRKTIKPEERQTLLFTTGLGIAVIFCGVSALKENTQTEKTLALWKYGGIPEVQPPIPLDPKSRVEIRVTAPPPGTESAKTSLSLGRFESLLDQGGPK